MNSPLRKVEDVGCTDKPFTGSAFTVQGCLKSAWAICKRSQVQSFPLEAGFKATFQIPRLNGSDFR